MSGKLAIAVLLALQASLCLCQIPEPDADLVEKYNVLKTAFYHRLVQAYGKLKDAMGPTLEGSTSGQAAKDFIEELQTKPGFQTAFKIATDAAGEMAPLVDKARTSLLGLYGHYLRPSIGTNLDEAITKFRAALESVWPAEHSAAAAA